MRTSGMMLKEKSENRRVYENEAGDFVIEVKTIKHNRNPSGGLMCLWVKSGQLSEFIEKTLDVRTYWYDNEGNCLGRFNIQMKRDNDCLQPLIDFDYMLPATEENEKMLVGECERLMLEGTAGD